MELHELRIHRLEELTTSMIESQASMVQILQERTSRFDRIEQRIDNVEKQLELVLTDLAFIKEILLRPK